MEKWYVSSKKADFEKWSDKFNISPVVARIIRNRDIVEENEVEKFLNRTLVDCYSPYLLYDMERAVNIIKEAIRTNKRIRIIGDYDVDGICAAYILTKGLSALTTLVDTAIPHRIKDGYGLNNEMIEEAKEADIQLIITCDNGIAAKEQIQLAKDYGMNIIVTDHHEVPYEECEENGILHRYEIKPNAEIGRAHV